MSWKAQNRIGTHFDPLRKSEGGDCYDGNPECDVNVFKDICLPTGGAKRMYRKQGGINIYLSSGSANKYYSQAITKCVSFMEGAAGAWVRRALAQG